ncbi:MAG: glutamate-5-semialdehyde dehydrogenase [Chitinophagales bacterium]
MQTNLKNKVLNTMAALLEAKRKAILDCNQIDVNNYKGSDQSMYDRLIVNDKKVDGMIQSVTEVMEKSDPVGQLLSEFQHENGLQIENRTSPFGTILIIYESRPDVSIEAAALAFKAGNRILLKGGKEAVQSNLKLVEIWHQALEENGLSKDWVKYLQFTRPETQAFLKQPTEPVDLIVPRGGEALIEYVKTHSTAPVLVSGRGNNFLYVHEDADVEQSLKVILNAKTAKISACNALDKVLIYKNLPDFNARVQELAAALLQHKVAVTVDKTLYSLLDASTVSLIDDEAIWAEEFLAMKIVLGAVDSMETAIEKINHYSGKHSVVIMTKNKATALQFMTDIDAAAVYHNASTRFTDGGQFGMGAELAISTDKLHHRGPLGLSQLVTNKWFVFGSGQVR